MRNIQEIQFFLSEPRLAPYIDYCKGNSVKGLLLYQMNLRLSAAFMPLLSMLEVALRNAIDHEMENVIYCDNDWIEKFRAAILIKIDKEKVQENDFNVILKAIENVKKGLEGKLNENIKNYLMRKYRSIAWFKKKTYKERKNFIQSELSKKKMASNTFFKKNLMISQIEFSFWTSMFEVEPFKVSEGKLLNIFRNKENKDINRKAISNKLQSIRLFRNRVAHNESIIFNRQEINLGYTMDIYSSIIFILDALNQDIRLYSEDTYNIQTNIQKISDYSDLINKIVKS